MLLSKLCEKIEFKLLQGSMDTDVEDIIYDSRKVGKGHMFVCMVGAVTDGHKYIPDAAAKGASAIVVERESEAENIPENITVIKVESARYALALMSAAYFGYPAEKLTTIGLTGTKGKTTTTYIIKDVLQQAGKKSGLIGTIATIIGEESVPAKNTTPESYEIHKAMAEMVKAGCEYMVMEVSSQGIKFDRTAGITFDYGVFTNLSPDHIGPTEHPDFDDYLECKSRLFRQCETGIVNIDDKYAEEILKNHTCSIVTFAAEREADLAAYDIEFLNEDGKLGMRFKTKGLMNCEAKIHIPGRFSVYNALTTMAVCSKLGIP
ncbi:MAG: Mur ligase family protein, partial [Anaerovoracaceae bacterium]